MNLKYHASIGILGELILGAKGLFLLASIAPDLTLVYNELKNISNKNKFDSEKVDKYSYFFYHCSHSLFISIFLIQINFYIGFGHFIHVIADWFTHTGRFAAMPFYPFIKWRITFGRNILK